MFDWYKYNSEWKKRNIKSLLILFSVWAAFTVVMLFVLSNVPTTGLALLGLGAYALAAVGYGAIYTIRRRKESLLFKVKMMKECAEEFLNEKGLLGEFKQFAGEEFFN